MFMKEMSCSVKCVNVTIEVKLFDDKSYLSQIMYLFYLQSLPYSSEVRWRPLFVSKNNRRIHNFVFVECFLERRENKKSVQF